jgi:DNA-binding SARP family transcriptional activator
MVPVRYGLLGPLEVGLGASRVRPRSRRQRAVLSMLLLRANRVVPIDDLIDACWELPPATAREQTHGVVFRLRALLGEPAGAALRTAPPGYLLEVRPDELDLEVFERLIGIGRAHDAAGNPAAASDRLSEALELWRGPALPDLDAPRMVAEAGRLDELRFQALTTRIALDLRLGREQLLVPELTALVAGHPYREDLRGQLMVALYRTGRQAEALAAYREGRRVLHDEVGVEPGEDLRALERSVLNRDPALGGTRPPDGDDSAPAPGRRHDLPPVVHDLTGREAELGVLLAATRAVDQPVVVTVDGMGGVGKTTLALYAAHRLAPDYPDGCFFLDLRAHSVGQDALDPRQALGALLRADGVPAELVPDQVEERVARWRARSAGRRLLVVLDNAASAAQVRPLLTTAPGCATIVTSRRRLAGLDRVTSICLEVLAPDAAAALFGAALGGGRAAAEPDAVAEVVDLCGHLPLAIQLAGARLRHRPSWTVAHLADRLTDRHRRLTELSAEDRSVASALALSYEPLPDAERWLFRLLSMVPGNDFHRSGIAAAADLDGDDAEDLLQRLVDAHLVEQREPDRYHLHDLTRQFARETAEREDPVADRTAALDRVLDHLFTAAMLAVDRVAPQRHRVTLDGTRRPELLPDTATAGAARAWLETERANIADAVRVAHEYGRDTGCWRLAHAMSPYYLLRAYSDDWLATHEIALAAARRSNDRLGEAITLAELGTAGWHTARYAEATALCEQALAIHRELGNLNGQSVVLRLLGSIDQRQGRYTDALRHLDASAELGRRMSDRRLEANASSSAAIAHYRSGRAEQAADLFRTALVGYRAVDDPGGVAATLTNLGYVLAHAGRCREARDHLERSLVLRETVGDSHTGQTLTNLAIVHRKLGQPVHALEHHARALESFRRSGDRSGESEALNDLADTLATTGPAREAYRRYAEALDVAVDTGNSYQQARAHEGLSRTGSTAAIRDEHRRRALAVYTQLGAPDAERLRASRVIET